MTLIPPGFPFPFPTPGPGPVPNRDPAPETAPIDRSGLLAADGKPVPLVGIKISGTVVGLNAELEIAQRFKNTEKVPIEATYAFPLPNDGAVCGFSVRVGDRTIVGRVDEREAAFEAYDEAMAEGHGAYLLDQEKPNWFHLSVGNLPPGGEAVVTIRLLHPARPEPGGLRLMIPTTISPRYVPSTLSDEVRAEIERVTPPHADRVGYGVELDLQFEMGSAIRAVESPSHPLRVECDGPRARVSFATGQTLPDRDLVINVETVRPREASAFVTRVHGRDHLLVELYPEVPQDQKPGPRDIVFVLDCSGSMAGSSIEQARRAIDLCLRSLAIGDRFQIIRFGSTCERMFPAPLVFGQDTLERAAAAIRGIEADLGGTEILPALQAAAGEGGAGGANHLEILVFTDGQVGNDDDCIAWARQHRGRIRIFSFGIGAGVSETLVAGLARETDGACELIAAAERIERKVMRQFARIGTPVLSDVCIDWAGQRVEAAPLKPPPVFDGDAFLAAARIKGAGTVADGAEITLRGRSGTTERTFSARVRRLDDASAIALFWARQAIRDRENGVESAVAGSNQRRQRAKAAKPDPAGAVDPVVALSIEYGLLSGRTSFIAVEERTDAERTRTQAELRRVPVMITDGWHGRFGQATSVSCSVSGGLAAALLPLVQHGICAGFSEKPSEDPEFLRRRRPPASAKSKRRRESAADVSVAEEGARHMCYSATLSVDDGSFDEVRCVRSGMVRGDRESGLIDLLQLQRADGSFPLNEQLADAVGIPLATVRAWADAQTDVPASNRPAALATALAITICLLRYADDRDLWKPGCEKALIWLTKTGLPESGQGLLRWLQARHAEGAF